MHSRPTRRSGEETKRTRRRIEVELERRGVTPEFSADVSERLAPFVPDLSSDAFEGVLSGIVLAFGVHREATADGPDLQTMLEGFVEELQKLDEALGTLAAYVTRLGQRAVPRDSSLH